jgi:hypothetical protein
MHKRSISLALILLITALGINVYGQSKATDITDPVRLLPPSDIVATFDVNRLLTEAFPRLFAKSPATLARMNTELDDFKTKTGFDLRSINRIAIGARDVSPNTSHDKWKGVIITQGNFNAHSLLAFGKLALKGKYQEQQHNGQTIYIFLLNPTEKASQDKTAPLPSIELAMAALNNNTLAIGKPESLRMTIDIGKEKAQSSIDMVELATRDPQALIGLGINVEPLMANFPSTVPAKSNSQGLTIDPIEKLGSANSEIKILGEMEGEFKKIAESIKHVHVSTGMTPTTFNVSLIKQIATTKADPQTVKMLERIKVSIQDNDVQIKADAPQQEVADLVKTAVKPPIQKKKPVAARRKRK